MAQENYRYKREDFRELPVTLHHLDIYLNFMVDYVEATNVLDMTARTALDVVALDANALDIRSVEWLDAGSPSTAEGLGLGYDNVQDQHKLVVRLPHTVAAGERFKLRTITRCVPSDHILEGIYLDTTPPGAPQQYMSQCQQWGFQRIMPIFDDCCAKCTFTTVIEADARYTHLISNGNISKETNHTEEPTLKQGDPTRKIITFENTIPMAPYLFIACVGTWDTLVDEVTLDSGRKVRLEYLVPPGRVAHARIPMDILKQSVLWISRTQHYEYPNDTYRTICMNKSNFGGMENVGNTTIVTDAALVDEHTLDQTLMYAHAVIVHEFEHNQCGSETTMETPFDVWLNEAYTVDVERQFMADVFDPAFVRLAQVDTIRHPVLGPLAIEDGGIAGKIVREGFNDPDELIDGVTYVKAAEVIRMLRLIVGNDRFIQGKDLYFSRYKHANANSDQFFACFEEVSARSLAAFKKTWLHTIGYPQVSASTAYDAATKRYTIHFRQRSRSGESFHLPIDLALMDRQGRVMQGTEQVFQLAEPSGQLTFENIAEPPAFVSLNRDYSFYGTMIQEDTTPEALAMQALGDSNAFNRVEAMRQLTDRVRISLMHDPMQEVDSEWLGLYGKLLSDRSLPPGLKAYLIRIEGQPLDRQYAAWYREQVTARDTLMRAVNTAYRSLLRELFLNLETYKPRKSPKDGIEDRILKHVLLDLLVIDDSRESRQLILDHYAAATTNADRVAALLALNRSAAPERKALLEKTYYDWHEHLSGYANFLRIIASGTRNDVFDMIAAEKLRPTFDMRQPTWTRALFLSMAGNTKMAWSDRGIQWIGETVTELSRVNWFTASRLLNTFQQMRQLRPEVQPKVREALLHVAEHVPPEVSQPVHAQASAYLG